MSQGTLRRFTWPILASLLVVGLAGREPSLVDSRDHALAAGATLHLPPLYVALSPLSRTLDTLTLLSVPQTIWLFVVVAAIVLIWMFRRPRSRSRKAWLTVAIGICSMIAAVAVIETALILLPRPMAALRAADPETVIIDFHSHTNASRDANKRFTPADNREWHESGGFNVAYISDHVRFAGAAAAMQQNPQRAGDGLTILSAVEGRYHRILSTIMLGLTQADTTVLDGKGHLLPGTPSIGKVPVTIVAIPNGNIDSVTAESLDSLPHFAGMELVDAAPRGLGQLDREEAKIRRIASDRQLVLVASSNNHGWGRTVAGWSLMTIPGWRELSPDSISTLIEKPFRERQTGAVTIVKRLRPRTHGMSLPLTFPIAAYQTLGSLTWTERGVWIAWIWGIALVAWALAQRRKFKSALPGRG